MTSAEAEPFPYNTPPWRRNHAATSPDQQHVAKLEGAWELFMSGPTYGCLHIDSALTIPGCSPVFLWSSDSQFLVAVQWWRRFGILRRQRLLLLDISRRTAAASKAIFRLIVLDEFTNDELCFSDSPLYHPRSHRLSVTTMRQTFAALPYDAFSATNSA